MMDQYYGHKELYSVVLRAKTSLQFGDRYIEAQEPVLYFDNVNMSLLSERSSPVFARGGWGNMPRVIWDERSEVQFQMTEGVMSSVGMGILLSSNVMSEKDRQPLYIPMFESDLKPLGSKYKKTISREENGETITDEVEFPVIEIQHKPVMYPERKTFIFSYERKAVQQGFYGEYFELIDDFNLPHYRIALATDKKITEPVKNIDKFAVDYYYKYEDEALIYSVQKERFNGLFTLEAKFYSQDENEGQKYTNILYMPKVRIVSNINLRLGERADPTVSTFNIIGLPETVGETKNMIMEITRLAEPDGDI